MSWRYGSENIRCSIFGEEKCLSKIYGHPSNSGQVFSDDIGDIDRNIFDVGSTGFFGVQKLWLQSIRRRKRNSADIKSGHHSRILSSWDRFGMIGTNVFVVAEKQ
ncbi:uncharacterized protein LOC135832501 [Planococcus citri]|uniref:uncharacterized protein LOC135832501 n=1 Tax=Planococcus citri TaxID=170843 RepID=UPI0031F90712